MESKFFCKYCGCKMSAEDEIFGEEIECPRCSKKIIVPCPDSGIETASTWTQKEFVPTIRPALEKNWETGKESPETTGNQVISPSPRQKFQTKKNTEKNKVVSGIRKSSLNTKKKATNSHSIVLVTILLLLTAGIGIFFLFKEKRSTNAKVYEEKTNLERIIPEEKVSVLNPSIAISTDAKPEKDKIASLSQKEIEPDFCKFEFDVVKNTPAKDGLSVEYGEFTLEVGLSRNEIVKVHYGIALDEDGKPGKNADNIVFYAPYFPERGFFKRPCHKWFPETAGYTIYSFDIVSDLSEVDVRDKMYYYQESGFHDLVFKVQKILQDKFNLKPKKLLIVGESAGGTMAQQLGCYSSDKIDAIAITGGHRFDLPQKGNKIAWLSIHTTGDTQRLLQQYWWQDYMESIGLQLPHTEVPPNWKNKGGKFFHHATGEHNWPLLQLFIKGVVKLRDENNGQVPHFRKWPEKVSYDGKTWYFPSKEFADKWMGIPHEAILELSRYKHKLDKPVYFIPPEDRPKAIVVYVQDPMCDEEVPLIDNLYYFMEKNVVACGIRMQDDYFVTLKNIEKAIEEVMAKKEWGNLPIYVCGAGYAGQLAAVAALKKGEWIEKKRVTKKRGKVKISKNVYIRHSRVKKITIINSDYDYPFTQLSIIKTRLKYKRRIPMRMIYSSGYAGQIPRSSTDAKVEKMDIADFTLGKKWFNVLSEIARGE